MLCPVVRTTKSFFYVGNGDKHLFGADVLDGINIVKAEAVDSNTAMLSWKVDTPFYASGMDWSVVYRRVGDKMNVFHEAANLNKFASNSSTASTSTFDVGKKNDAEKKSGNLTGTSVGADGTLHNMLSSLEPDTFYVACVAIVEANNYYIHLSKCMEVRTLPKPSSESSSATTPATAGT